MGKFRTALAVSFLFLLALPALVMGADFRNTKWGMSKREVKKAEKIPKEAKYSKNNISTPEKLGGLPAILAYDFNKKKLVRGRYSFAAKHLDAVEYIDDYKKLKKMLTIKYGKPNASLKNWTDRSMKSFPHQRGMAVRLGHLTLLSIWDRKRTKIMLALYGEKERVKMVLTYESMKLLQSREKLATKTGSPRKPNLKKYRKNKLEEDLKKL